MLSELPVMRLSKFDIVGSLYDSLEGKKIVGTVNGSVKRKAYGDESRREGKTVVNSYRSQLRWGFTFG